MRWVLTGATVVHRGNSLTREILYAPFPLLERDSGKLNRLVNKVLPFEESSKVEDLPYAQSREGEQCEPCKVLDTGIC